MPDAALFPCDNKTFTCACSDEIRSTYPEHIALGILSELFPDRTVVGIHAVDLVWGFGTLHCLTQQQPAR